MDNFAVQGKPMNDAWRKVVETAGGLVEATKYYGKGSRAERLWINRLIKAYDEVERIREENMARKRETV